MAKVSGLYRVGLRVPDMAAAAHFYEHVWGMQPSVGDAQWQGFHFSGAGHDELTLRAGPAALDAVALSVPDEASLLQLLGRVADSEGSVESGPQSGQLPGEGLVAVVRDVEGNRLELVVPAAGGQEACSGGPGRRLGHVVLWAGDIPQQEAFYRLLGLEVSDRTHIGMSFLRCNTDHHSVALARSATGRRGLQHIAFDIGTLDDVMREFARLRDHGAQCIWGVGRHGPGNNVFAYYADPAGNVVEYYGDMETVEAPEVAEVRFWGPEHKGDIWGVAGAPPMPFRG